MLASDDFAFLVEQAREGSILILNNAKRIFQILLPDVEALQKENANFSPRLMLLMHARVSGKLPVTDYTLLGTIILEAEQLQPVLLGWMTSLGKPHTVAGKVADKARCREMIAIHAKRFGELDAILARLTRRG
jgi:hypothetical protein